MTERVPDYFLQFRCAADKCTDSCCRGWEIDIDEEALSRYQTGTECYTDRIRDSISYDGTPHFALCDGARCPHLNEKGLCEIIANLGEEWLCDICREHPRYYNVCGDIREGGLGLCCESAAELILGGKGMPSITERAIPETDGENREEDTELSELIFASREVIYSKIFDTSLRITDIFEKVAVFTERLEDELFFDNRESARAIIEGGECSAEAVYTRCYERRIDEIIHIISSLEAKEEMFTDMLDKARKSSKTLSECFYRPSCEEDGYIRRLLFYFIHRYYSLGAYDLRIGARAKIAIFSTIAIFATYKSSEKSITILDCAKEYSKNAEYSDENTELYLDLIYESEL